MARRGGGNIQTLGAGVHNGSKRGRLPRVCLAVFASSWLFHAAALADEAPVPDITLGGYVKVDYIQDLDPIGNAYQFKTDAIPVEGNAAASQAGQTTLHARETRVTLTAVQATDRGNVKAYLEADFFGDNGAFRIRQAYGEFAEFLGGQTWTTFMDFSARPRSLDYEGPDGEVFVRQAMIRWTHAVAPNWKLAVAVEQPGGQFAKPDTLVGSARSNIPDLPAFIRHEGQGGHAQLAGILRQIRFDGESGSPDVSTTGYGLNVSFRINTSGRDGLMGEAAFGNGIGRYIESLGGQNADAVFVGYDRMEALQATSGVIGYEGHWTPSLQSTVALAAAFLKDSGRLPSSSVRSCKDARANLIWTPYKNVDVGGEALRGQRKNQDGAHGEAWRLQFSRIYKFN